MFIRDRYYTDNSQRTVMWNTYLNRYVMISADRIHHLNISYSEDLIHWTQPEIFLQEESGVPILYANLISFDSNDTVSYTHLDVSKRQLL